MFKMEQISPTKHVQSNVCHKGISSNLLGTCSVKQDINQSAKHCTGILDDLKGENLAVNKTEQQGIMQKAVLQVGECPSKLDENMSSESISSLFQDENLERNPLQSNSDLTIGSEFMNLMHSVPENTDKCRLQKNENAEISSIPISLCNDRQNEIFENQLNISEDMENELVDVSIALFGERIALEKTAERRTLQPLKSSSVTSTTHGVNIEKEMTNFVPDIIPEAQSSSISLIHSSRDSSSLNTGKACSVEMHERPPISISISSSPKQSSSKFPVSNIASLSDTKKESHDQAESTCLFTNPSGLFQNTGKIFASNIAVANKITGSEHPNDKGQMDTLVDVPNDQDHGGIVNLPKHRGEGHDMCNLKSPQGNGEDTDCKDMLGSATNNMNKLTNTSPESRPSINKSMDLKDGKNQNLLVSKADNINKHTKTSPNSSSSMSKSMDLNESKISVKSSLILPLHVCMEKNVMEVCQEIVKKDGCKEKIGSDGNDPNSMFTCKICRKVFKRQGNSRELESFSECKMGNLQKKSITDVVETRSSLVFVVRESAVEMQNSLGKTEDSEGHTAVADLENGLNQQPKAAKCHDDKMNVDINKTGDGDDDDDVQKMYALSSENENLKPNEYNDSTDDDEFKPPSEDSDSSDDDFKPSKIKIKKQANRSKTDTGKGNGRFVCTICKKTFARAFNLKRHKLVHTGASKQFPCEKCGKLFRRSDNAQDHRRLCLCKCRFCGLKLDSEDRCEVHEKECNGLIEGLFDRKSSENSDLIDKEFESSESKIGNNDDIGIMRVNRRHVCTICNKTFPRSSSLIRHRVLHTDEPDQFPCIKCSRSFNRKDYTQRHERGCICKCKCCGLKFDSIGECNEHENECTDKRYALGRCPIRRSHRKQGSKHYVCKICEKEFKKGEHLRKHMNRHHTDPVKCEACDVICKSVETYKYHYQVKHAAKESDKWLCTFCGKDFNCKKHFRLHEAKHNGTAKQFPCDMCDKVFECKSYLKKHKYVHSEVRNYLCRHCGMAFKLVNHLRNHELSHNEECIFKCSQCDKAFKKPQALKRHQNIHTGDRPYKCRFCDKRFTQSTAQYSHELIHKGIKKHVCEFCGKKFTLRHHLGQHLKTHTNERPYVCKICGDGFKIGHHLTQHMATHDNKSRKK